MVHANSDPASSSMDQLTPTLLSKSAITPPSMSLTHHHNVGGNIIKRPHELYSENYVHPPPLENRNSAPEIVVLSPGRELPKIPVAQSQQETNQISSKKGYNMYGVEDRINRAKAKVFQNGGLFRSHGGGSKDYFHDDDPQLMPSIYPPGATSISTGPCSTGSGQVRQKLSTRFHSAQKLNYKLAALSNFASGAAANINVRRSRTFNISDMHEQLNMVGNGGSHTNIIYDSSNEPVDNTRYYTKTLPKQMKTSNGGSSSQRKTQTLMRKLEPSSALTVSSSSARDSNSSSSSGVCCGSYSSDITTTTASSSNGSGSVGDLGSGSSSTTSSRKSSNSSSKEETTIEDDGTGTEVRSEIKEDALKEIAAFESFIANFVVQQNTPPKVHHHNNGCTTHPSNPNRFQKAQLAVPGSSTLNKTVDGIPPSGQRGRRTIANGGVVRTLERQKKITSMSSQNSEEA